MTWRFVLALAMAIPATLGAQDLFVPKAVWLEFRSLKIAISPDSSGGTLVWVKSTADTTKPTTFHHWFNPDDLAAWIAATRSFLDLGLKDGDSTTIRTSPRLRTGDNRGIYVARRQQKGAWTSERFLILEPRGAPDPIVLNGTEKNVREILDSLEAVVMRTPILPPRAASQVAVAEEYDVSKPARPYWDNQPPLYPENERRFHQDGVVVLSFVIGVNGRVDMSTVRVVFSTNSGFLRAVLAALPPLRFYPAEQDGKPVRQVVHMPFEFTIIR